MKIQLSDHFTYRKLFRFVLPSIVMMIFTSIYTVVDGLFVSNYVGKTAFAAINLCMPLLMGVSALGFMIGTGGSAIVARTLGEGHKEKANASFSLLVYVMIIGGLILGDFAVQAEWLSPEVLVYMAFVSVSGFTQPSYEMDYAFKLLRLMLLLLSAAFDLWGFALGLLGIVILLATCRPIAGGSYLYPLIPFDGKALRRLLLREPISRDNT